MSQILVRNTKPETINSLKLRAIQNRRSLTAEINLVLDEAAEAEKLKHAPKFTSLRELINGKPMTNRTQAEIDAYVRALRDEWDN